MGVDYGTVRKWTSSGKTPKWATNFIYILKENENNKIIVDKIKELTPLLYKK